MEHERRTQDTLDLKVCPLSVCPLFSRSSVADSAVFFFIIPSLTDAKEALCSIASSSCPPPLNLWSVLSFSSAWRLVLPVTIKGAETSGLSLTAQRVSSVEWVLWDKMQDEDGMKRKDQKTQTNSTLLRSQFQGKKIEGTLANLSFKIQSDLGFQVFIFNY